MTYPRSSKKIGPFLLRAGGPNQLIDSIDAFEVGASGLVSIQCVIDNGSTGQDPSDNPQGSWRLYGAGDTQAPFARIVAAESGEFSLADIAPIGNTFVNAIASFECFPGVRGKIQYVYGSGGANTRCTLYVTAI